MDRGTAIGVRFDGKRSIHQSQPFLHTDKPNPATLFCGFTVKARA